jgi:hypothetical protein
MPHFKKNRNVPFFILIVLFIMHVLSNILLILLPNPDIAPIKEKDIYKAMCTWCLHKCAHRAHTTAEKEFTHSRVGSCCETGSEHCNFQRKFNCLTPSEQWVDKLCHTQAEPAKGWALAVESAPAFGAAQFSAGNIC